MNNAKIYIESNSVKLSEHSGDYEAVSKYHALKALEMQEQNYAWHDLTVNPDDHSRTQRNRNSENEIRYVSLRYWYIQSD